MIDSFLYKVLEITANNINRGVIIPFLSQNLKDQKSADYPFFL